MLEDPKQFEAEVQRVARSLWPQAAYAGSVNREGRERDGEFETDDIVHLVECTISRKKDKATEDIAKLKKRLSSLRHSRPNKLARGWFVTLHEPTADQQDVVEGARAPIIALSFAQFRAKLIDASAYLQCRDKYAFGSMRDPTTGAFKSTLGYVPVAALDTSGLSTSVEGLAVGLMDGSSYILTGDYGAGKSSTLREVFVRLERRFRAHEHSRFPVFLNLRDHHGQRETSEALQRHARRIGYEPESALVRAWRGGYVDLLLDGFDELAVAGWAGSTKRLREIRHRSMELVRAFVDETPKDAGLIVTGREHYFDSASEMRTALGRGRHLLHLRLAEFSASQVQEFLGKLGWRGSIPEWFPSRPLLLGYLAARGLIDVVGEVGESSPADGWHHLLSRIAEREAEIEAGIAAETVRVLIEELAIAARRSPDGLGPLYARDIVGVFEQVCGYEPDNRGTVLLQRLPGLGASQTEDGARVFVDRDFAEAARGGAVARFVRDPFGQSWDTTHWDTALTRLGSQVASVVCHAQGLSSGHVRGALPRTVEEDGKGGVLTTDTCLTALDLGGSLGDDIIYVTEVWVPELTIDEGACDLHRIEFQDCIFQVLDYSPETEVGVLPRFRRCSFGMILGFAGPSDLPSQVFVDCEFHGFEDTARTTRGILELNLPLGVRVGLTVLKKLYVQSGSGRKTAALYRGLDPRARDALPDVLGILRRNGFALPTRQGGNDMWMPAKGGDARGRALAVLAAPTTSTDPLLTALRGLR